MFCDVELQNVLVSLDLKPFGARDYEKNRVPIGITIHQTWLRLEHAVYDRCSRLA